MDPRCEDIRRLIEQSIPFLTKVAVKVETIEPGRARMRLPADPTNDNYVGLIHAGALFTFGETCAGAAAGAAVDLGRMRMLASQSKIEYRRPARGELLATAEIRDVAIEELESRVDDEGKVRFPVHVALADQTGETVAEMVVDYHVKKITGER